MRHLAFALALLCVPAVVLAQEAAQETSESPELSLDAALSAIRIAPSAAGENAVSAALLLDPSVADVAAALARGVSSVQATAGWTIREAVDTEGVARPYHLYVPESVATSRDSAPLLVDLHGGVSRPEFIDDEGFAGRAAMMQFVADEHGVVLAAPKGRGDCTWWTDAGVRHIRAVIRDVKRHAPIDDERIVASGFSDGASGCYYLAMAAPDPFAALIPMNGHPLVATGASGRQLYLRNAAAMPLFVAMTQDDGLYPAQVVLPHIQELIRNGASCRVVSYPTGGHSPVYLEEQAAAIGAFVAQARRAAQPETIEWATAHGETARSGWIEVTSIRADAETEQSVAIPDIQVMSTPGRVLIGIGVDQEFAGPGIRVTSVDARRPAGPLGLQVGDVVVRVDDTEIVGMRELRAVLGAKAFGDSLRVRIVREGVAEPLDLETTIPAFVPEPTYSRELPTAWLRATRKGNAVDVTAIGVGGLRLHLHPGTFDPTAELVVTVNGQERFRGVPAASVEMLIRSWARDADVERTVAATVDVDLPAEPISEETERDR